MQQLQEREAKFATLKSIKNRAKRDNRAKVHKIASAIGAVKVQDHRTLPYHRRVPAGFGYFNSNIVSDVNYDQCDRYIL